MKYTKISITPVKLDIPTDILAASIVDNNTNVVIPRGQAVDEIDFSDSQFVQDWTI